MIKKTALFIMPRSSKSWKGAEALWITAAGWAAAAEMMWNHSLVGTTDTVVKANEVLSYPVISNSSSSIKINKGWKSRIIPQILITAIKDWKLNRSQPKIWPFEKVIDSDDYEVQFIWEQHDLFKGPGKRIATKLNVPLVLYVHAPVVWEAAKWGVKRPIWGYLLEKYVEAKNLKEANLIACVSEDVKQQVIKMGIDESKIVIAPMSVDGCLFNPLISGKEIRKVHKIEDKILIGWTGSFRVFHGLDKVIHSFDHLSKENDKVVLMLVGEGQWFDKIKKLVAQLRLEEKVIFIGKKPFIEVPKYVAAFDIALVSSNSSEGFHYSPLKLREYLACGKACIAPMAGDLPNLFKDNEEVVFYNPDVENSLYEKMTLLVNNEGLRNKLSENMIKIFQSEGTWLHELKKVCDILNIVY